MNQLSESPLRNRSLAVAVLILIVFAPLSAQAGLMLLSGTNEKCVVAARYNWDGAADEKKIPPPNGPGAIDPKTGLPKPNPWSGTVTAKADRVEAVLQHHPGMPVCDDNHGSNSSTLDLTAFVPPLTKPNARRKETFMTQVSHGLKHFDIGSITLDLKTDDKGDISSRTVKVAATHKKNIGLLVKTSVRNNTKKDADVIVYPDYREIVEVGGTKTVQLFDDLSQQINETVEKGEKMKFGPFDEEFRGGVLASMTKVIKQSAPTTTKMAFLGTVDGLFTELDLATAIDFMVGTEEFFVPNLRPVDGMDTVELFVAIDLSQWLGAEAMFSVGDVFTLVDGMSDLLPGVLVSASEITLGADGYETDDPVNGDVMATLVIDGQVVDTPTPLALLIVGVAGAGLASRRRMAGQLTSEPAIT